MAAYVATPDLYLAQVPDARRELVDDLRRTILGNVPPGIEEIISYGMIAYVVPLSTFRDTYNGQPLPLVALAAQKRYVSVYLMGVYGDPAQRDWFVDAWAATGRTLDMGKSCVRLRSVDDVAFDVLGEAVARVTPAQLISAHLASHQHR